MPDQQAGTPIAWDEQGKPIRWAGGPVTTPTATGPQETPNTPVGRSTLQDVGIGALKGAGRGLLDLGRMASVMSNPGLVPFVNQRFPDLEALEPSNTTQSVAGFIPDALSVMTPGGMAAQASRLVPKAAIGMLRRVVPTLTKEGAEVALSQGAGRIAQKSADTLSAAAKSMQSARTPSGQWMPGPAGVRNASKAMGEAVKQTPPRLSNTEILGMIGTGGVLQSPIATGAIALAHALRRPKVASSIAQGLYSSAPAIQAAGGGAAMLGIEQLMKRLFGRDE